MSTEKTVRRQSGEVEENELRLDREKSKEIVEALNDDLADTFTLYHQLRKHHWNVEGAEFRDLHIFLGEAAENGDVIESLREHVELATELGDHATAQILRDILVQTEEDAHHIEHYLEDDTLVAETSGE